MEDYKKIKLEDHPEYLDFVVQILTVTEQRLRQEGYEGEELEKKLEEEKKKLGL